MKSPFVVFFGGEGGNIRERIDCRRVFCIDRFVALAADDFLAPQVGHVLEPELGRRCGWCSVGGQS